MRIETRPMGWITKALLCCWMPCTVFATTITGKSYDSQSLELRYIEQHVYDTREQKATVTYVSPDSELLAHKTLSYAVSSLCPSFEIHLSDNEQRLGVTRKAEQTYLFIKGNNGREQQKQLPQTLMSSAREPLVCDAGFDFFIREVVLKKDSFTEQRFYFALPNHLDYLAMRLSEVHSSDTDNKIPALIKQHCDHCSVQDLRFFKIEAANWLYRQLSEPVTLVYNKQQLLLFSGRSNIANKNNDIGDVIIVYEQDSANLPQAAQGTLAASVSLQQKF